MFLLQRMYLNTMVQWTNSFGFAMYSPWVVILIWKHRPHNRILCLSSASTEIWGILLYTVLQLLQLFVLRREVREKEWCITNVCELIWILSMCIYWNAYQVMCIYVKTLISYLQGCTHWWREVRDADHAVLFKISNQLHGIQPARCIQSVFICLRIPFWLIIQYGHVLFWQQGLGL